MAVPKPRLTTKVVHHNQPHDVYIGRPSPFGNPYTVIGENGREKALKKFEEYFVERMDHDPRFYLEVIKLKGKTLGCFCAPLRCHGDIIAEYLERHVK